MTVKKEIDIFGFDDLKDMCWSGALQVLEQVEKKGLKDELIELLEDLGNEEEWEETQLNDFIWFDLENWDGFTHLYDEDEEEAWSCFNYKNL